MKPEKIFRWIEIIMSAYVFAVWILIGYHEINVIYIMSTHPLLDPTFLRTLWLGFLFTLITLLYILVSVFTYFLIKNEIKNKFLWIHSLGEKKNE